MQLASRNRLHVRKEELSLFNKVPRGAGMILISNHADEYDPRVCLEISRLCRKRFISMCNREAFDELGGVAGWALQRLGHFSVERGAHDGEAKQFAIDIVKRARSVLVIFPEGEIFYLNEDVQHFHSGAVEICMQAIMQRRKKHPTWTACIVPMAIKYHYKDGIERILDERISRMERKLSLSAAEDSLAGRLKRIQTTLIQSEANAYGVQDKVGFQEDLLKEIVATENAILAEVESRHMELPVSHGQIIDESWQLGAEIREGITPGSDVTVAEQVRHDLAELREVAQLSSWRPDYYQGDVSHDRLAEALLKLERELYRVRRPEQLADRDVFVKIGTPIDMGAFASEYASDARAVRHSVTENLHSDIQTLVDALIKQCSAR